MKKTVVLWALFLGFALAATGCAPAAQSQNGDTFAVKSAFSLSQTLGKLTASPECVALFAGNNTIVSEATSLSAMDLAKPTRAEIITLPQQSVDSLLDYLSSSLTEDETLKNLLIRRLAASVPSRINGQAGVSWLATSSVLTVSETFSRTDMAGITYVILYYDGHPAATLTLLMPDGGFIQASSTYVQTETLQGAQLVEQLAAAMPEDASLDTGAIQSRQLTQAQLEALFAS